MTRVTRLLVAVGMLAAAVGSSLGGRAVLPAGADPPAPLLRVGNARIIEGDSGQAVVNVPVDLSEPASVDVTFNYAITADTATAGPGQDFVARAGKIKILAGVANKQISVRVYGDLAPEPEEHIAITLSNAVNATIAVAHGGVTIQDDDSDAQTGLQVNIGDVTVTEADAGMHYAEFAVTLSQPVPPLSSLKVYWTVDCATAFPSLDYTVKQHGTITFQGGTQSKLIKFKVVADLLPEDAEAILSTVEVTLGSATVNRTTGEGLIVDDDGFTPPPDPGNLGVGDVARVSVATDGSEAAFPPDGLCAGSSSWGSSQSVTNADGRYVAFRSDAGNLVPGDTNSAWDIFVRDRVAGTTERVSVGSDGSQTPPHFVGAPYLGADHPAISADGRYVTFYDSFALVPGIPDDVPGLYLHDRATGETELLSRLVDGRPGGVIDWSSPVSADGRYVAFWSSAHGFVPGDPVMTETEIDRVYVHDRVTGTNTMVSVAPDGSFSSGIYPSMTSDGRYVAFDSASGDLVPGDTNECNDVFVRDLSTGTTQRVSLTNDGQQELPALDQSCDWGRPVSISADGTSVAFTSPAWNQAGLASAPDYWYDVGFHIYVRNLTKSTTQRVDVVPIGRIGWGAHFPDVSDDGRFVSYQCDCDDGPTSVHLYDATLDVDTVVGDLPDGTLADDQNWATADGALSGDAHYIAFDSWATNLVPDGGDTNDKSDVFIQRLS
jgi:Tol biopolymer transport system component